ncbi:MAG TPA: signal peptidase I [Bacteroidota bacterium]|nr:signal peptidase I [Bacteroidota bacterium]
MNQDHQSYQAIPESKPSIGKSVRDYARTVLITLVVALFLKTFFIEAFRIPSASMEKTLLVGDFLMVNKFAYGLRTPRYVPLTNIAVPSLTIPSFKNIQRGDVVVFEFPRIRGSQSSSEVSNYVKRCVGLPGDTVEILDGELFVNGSRLLLPQDSFHEATGNGLDLKEHFGPVVVPKEGMTIFLNPRNARRYRRLLHHEGRELEVDARGRVLIDGEPATSYTVRKNYYFMLGDNRHNSLDSRAWGFVPESNIIGEALFVYWSWDPEVEASSIGERLKSVRWERIGTIIR